jgi:hypothetical protein
MGLGKTREVCLDLQMVLRTLLHILGCYVILMIVYLTQVCAFLRGMLYSKLITRAIIIAPVSVVGNWVPELLSVGLPCQM